MVEAGLIQPALVSQADGQHYEASFEREHQRSPRVHRLRSDSSSNQSEALEALQREIARRYEFELGRTTPTSCAGAVKACRPRQKLTQISAATWR